MGVDGKYLDVKISRWSYFGTLAILDCGEYDGIGATCNEAVDATVDLTLQQSGADPLGQGASQDGRQLKL